MEEADWTGYRFCKILLFLLKFASPKHFAQAKLIEKFAPKAVRKFCCCCCCSCCRCCRWLDLEMEKQQKARKVRGKNNKTGLSNSQKFVKISLWIRLNFCTFCWARQMKRNWKSWAAGKRTNLKIKTSHFSPIFFSLSQSPDLGSKNYTNLAYFAGETCAHKGQRSKAEQGWAWLEALDGTRQKQLSVANAKKPNFFVLLRIWKKLNWIAIFGIFFSLARRRRSGWLDGIGSGSSTRPAPFICTLIIKLQKGQSMFSQPHCIVELLGAFMEFTTRLDCPDWLEPYRVSTSMWPDRIWPVEGATLTGTCE